MFGTLVDDWIISLGVGTKTGHFRKFQIFKHTDISLCITLGHPCTRRKPRPTLYLLPRSPTLFIRRIHLRFMSIQFLLRPNLTTCQSGLSLYSSPRTRNRGSQIDVYLCLAQIFNRKSFY